jgi:hypothetical protein
MRILILALAAGLMACATGGGESTPDELGPMPFNVQRGTALPPPGPAGANTAPPEGRASAGIDFGQWRSADPVTYAASFQTQIRQRYSDGRDSGRIRTDLEANGFACEDGERLDCRIEIMERQCAIDWYVVVERARPEPIVGFDKMCLGAN